MSSRILLSTRNFIPPLIGGVDVYTQRLGKALERSGFEVGILAFNSSDTYEGLGIQVVEDSYEDWRVWRFKFWFKDRPEEAYHHGYDMEMGEQVRVVLNKVKPDLLIILNFYMSTLAMVEVAKELDIPVIHIASDFLPVCRRATFIRWDGKTCQTGESLKSCASCYVSGSMPGRIASKVLNQLPEKYLVSMASSDGDGNTRNPLRILDPYWKQVELMHKRLEILGPLRKKIDLVFAPTRFTARMFRENGFDLEQVHFLPFGVEADHPLASVEQSPADHVRFLFIGRLQPYKGAHLLVEAFNNLTAPKGATLDIYGVWDGYEEYFRAIKKKIDANGRIRFRGSLPPSDLNRAFAEADYFVLPSTWHENCPLIVLDALQANTPVIASEIGGITDIVKDGVNGILFPMGDFQALSGALQHAIDEPELLTELQAGVDLLEIDEYVQTLLTISRERGVLAQPAHPPTFAK